MTRVPRATLDALTRQVNAVSADARSKVSRALTAVDWSDVAAARDAVSQAMRDVCGSYSDVAAQAAAEFYDAVRELCVGEPVGALALPGYDPDATDGAVRALVQLVVDGNGPPAFDRACLDRVDHEVKRAAGNCVANNAARDPLKPRYARVPTGAETCEFCTMLASRGFVYATAASAGSNGHYHPGCDCRIVPGFSGATVEGYDPDAYFEMYVENQKARAERAARTAEEAGRKVEGAGRKVLTHGFKSVGEVQSYVRGAATVEELQERLATASDALAEMFSADALRKYEGMVAASARSRMRELRKV